VPKLLGVPVRKPSGFDLRPGQPSDLTLVNPPGNRLEGNVRTLSIGSVPSEDLLMFAPRMRDTAVKMEQAIGA